MAPSGSDPNAAFRKAGRAIGLFAGKLDKQRGLVRGASGYLHVDRELTKERKDREAKKVTVDGGAGAVSAAEPETSEPTRVAVACRDEPLRARKMATYGGCRMWELQTADNYGVTRHITSWPSAGCS